MLQSFQAWLASPFKSGMNAWDWFLFIGLLIVVCILWHMILRFGGVNA
jgi:hypothetical protein